MSGFFGGLAEAAAVGSALASGEGVLGALGLGDFAALGGIVFALLGSPERLNRRRRSNYARLPILTGRPVLQWTYDDLARIQINIKLHEMWLGSGGPDRTFAMLDQQRLSHAPALLVYGGNGAPEGTFVVTGLQGTDRWRYAGVSQWIDAELTLEEWVPTGPLGAAQPQPPTPPAGIIGVPGAFAALYAAGATIGLPLPTLGFAATAGTAIARMGAL